LNGSYTDDINESKHLVSAVLANKRILLKVNTKVTVFNY